MVRALGIVGLLVFAATVHRAVADEPKAGAAAPADPTAQLLAKLRQPLALAPADELQLPEFAAQVEKATGIPVSINRDAFRGDNSRPEEITVRVAGSKKLAGTVVMRTALGGEGLTYLVRRDHVEIVPTAYALKESRQPAKTDANGDPVAAYPLVSAVVRNAPLNAALDDLAVDYDLTVVLAPQAGDQKAAFVSARLLNVPADKAVELLALQADLRVVKRGPAFLVTTKDHAEGLFNERMDRLRQQAELENLRNPARGSFIGQPGVGLCGFGGCNGNLGIAGGGQLGQPPGVGCILGLGGLGTIGAGGKVGFGGGYGI
ncbi:MAG: hypothetical protein U0804_11730 [Gemmataceae bacterium]